MSTQAGELAASRMAVACGKRVEILAGRSEYTEVFANPDGTTMFTSTAVPARVRRADGSWVPVDTSLVRRSDGRLAPAAVVSDVVFSGGGSGPFVEYRDGGSLLALGLTVPLPVPPSMGQLRSTRMCCLTWIFE